MAELQAVVLADKWGAGTIYTDSYVVWLNGSHTGKLKDEKLKEGKSGEKNYGKSYI